jgi:hypothetical protein
VIENDEMMLSPTAGALLAILQFLAGMSGCLLIVLMTPFTQGGSQGLLFVLIYGTIVCPFVWLFGQHIQRLTTPVSAATQAIARSQLLGGVLLTSLYGLVVLLSGSISSTTACASLVGIIAGSIMAIQGQRLRQRLNTGPAT